MQALTTFGRYFLNSIKCIITVFKIHKSWSINSGQEWSGSLAFHQGSGALAILNLSETAVTQTRSEDESIDISIRKFVEGNRIPGFAACVVRNNEIIWSDSYGLADIRHNVPMSIDGIMNIGSVSKTFTAAAAIMYMSVITAAAKLVSRYKRHHRQNGRGT